MIISASRRTDIPSFYSDWFFDSVANGSGSFFVRNPRKYSDVKKILVSDVDGFVFWTKNPLKMFSRLGEIDEFPYYFQFTITPYGKDIEPNLPQKSEIMNSFKNLYDKIGKNRIVWRYDPILINNCYDFDFHVKAFKEMALILHKYVNDVTFSFIDTSYRNVKRNEKFLRLSSFSDDEKFCLIEKLLSISKSLGLNLYSCGEKTDFSELGISCARCINSEKLSNIFGKKIVEKRQNIKELIATATKV